MAEKKPFYRPQIWIPADKTVPESGFTHGGTFHADDVLATAVLTMLNPDFRVERGFEVPEEYRLSDALWTRKGAGDWLTGNMPKRIVYDIGGGAFDHHQKGAEKRRNGYPYAAFGLIWRRFGSLLLTPRDAALFDMEFVQAVDLSDNTGSFQAIAQTLHDYNPTWEETQDYDACFQKAVAQAMEILEGRFRQIRAQRDAVGELRRILDQRKREIAAAKPAEDADAGEKGKWEASRRVITLHQSLPWMMTLRNTDYLYVIYPSNRKGYQIQAIPSVKEKNVMKAPFPGAWRAKDPETLAKLTGIPDFRFCHESGYLSVTDTEESAEKVAEMAARLYLEWEKKKEQEEKKEKE